MPTKQKNGLYRAKVKIGVDACGKDIYKYVSGRTKRELEEARKQVVAFFIDGTGLAENELFGSYAVKWFNVYKAPRVTAGTRDIYRTILNVHLLPRLANRNLRAIKPSDLQALMNEFAGTSYGHITMVKATLSGIFQAAFADNIISSNPMVNIVKPVASIPKVKRALTSGERQVVEQLCITHADGKLLALLYYLGVRIGEAWGLQWGDIDWQMNEVHIQRDIDRHASNKPGALKNRQSYRYVPLPRKLREVLYPDRSLPGVYVLQGRDGKQCTPSEQLHTWERARDACGIEGLTAHWFRHNYITMCWEHNVDVYATARYVGHGNIRTTLQTYTHLSEERETENRKKVMGLFD